MNLNNLQLMVMRNLPQPMALIKVVPEVFDYLDSDLKKEEFGSRQHYEV